MSTTNVVTLAAPRLIHIVEDDMTKIDKMKNDLWESIKGEVSLDGFRKGHVPRSLAERKIALADLYPNVLESVFQDAVKTNKIKLVRVINSQARFELDQPVVLDVVVDVEPTVLDCKYLDLTIEPADETVTDEDIENIIKSIQDASAKFNPVTRPAQDGDRLTFDFEGKIDDKVFEGGSAKDIKYIAGSKGFLPEFEAQLAGVSAGTTKEFPLTFPADYAKADLSGKTAMFKVEVKEVAEKITPAIDDELAKANKYDNLEVMRSTLKEDQIANKKQQATMMNTQRALMQLLDKTMLTPVPNAMLENQGRKNLTQAAAQAKMSTKDYLARMNMSEEQYINHASAGASNDIKLRLALAFIAQKEGFTATDEDREVKYNTYAEQSKITVAEFKAKVSDLSVIDEEIILKKAYDFVLENTAKVAKTEAK